MTTDSLTCHFNHADSSLVEGKWMMEKSTIREEQGRQKTRENIFINDSEDTWLKQSLTPSWTTFSTSSSSSSSSYRVLLLFYFSISHRCWCSRCSSGGWMKTKLLTRAKKWDLLSLCSVVLIKLHTRITNDYINSPFAASLASRSFW